MLFGSQSLVLIPSYDRKANETCCKFSQSSHTASQLTDFRRGRFTAETTTEGGRSKKSSALAVPARLMVAVLSRLLMSLSLETGLEVVIVLVRFATSLTGDAPDFNTDRVVSVLL